MADLYKLTKHQERYMKETHRCCFCDSELSTYAAGSEQPGGTGKCKNEACNAEFGILMPYWITCPRESDLPLDKRLRIYEPPRVLTRREKIKRCVTKLTQKLRIG